MHCALSKYIVCIVKSVYCHGFCFRRVKFGRKNLPVVVGFVFGYSGVNISFSFFVGGGNSVQRFQILVHCVLRKMADRKKNTRAFAKTNPNIPLYCELPPVVRKNNNKKKGDAIHTWRLIENMHDNKSIHGIIKRTSSLSSKSENTRLFSGTFSTPFYLEQDFQDKVASPTSEPMSKSMNPKGTCKPVRSSPTQHKDSQSNFMPFVEKNLIDLDIIMTNSDDKNIGHNELIDELGVLRKEVSKEEVRHL